MPSGEGRRRRRIMNVVGSADDKIYEQPTLAGSGRR